MWPMKRRQDEAVRRRSRSARPTPEGLEGRALLSLTTIDFEGVTIGQYPDLSYYDFPGVAFQGGQPAKARTGYPAHSGSQLVLGSLTMAMPESGTWTKAGGYVTAGPFEQVTLFAYDANGQFVDIDSTAFIPTNPPNQRIEVAGPNIASVAFRITRTNAAFPEHVFALDDFYFEGEDPALPDLVAGQLGYGVPSERIGELLNILIPVGTEFTTTATVKNQGAGAAGRFNVKLFASKDATIDPTTDYFVSTLVSIPSLNAGSSYRISAKATLPLDLPKTYFGVVWLGLVVDGDNQVAESDEGNNSNQPFTVDPDSDVVVYGDKRPAELADPVARRGAVSRTFVTRQAAERYLTNNGFEPPVSFPSDNPSSWSRSLKGPIFSRNNGKLMLGSAFRIEAFIVKEQAGYKVMIQGGDPASFNPGNVTPAFGELNPRTAYKFGLKWNLYVKFFHYHF